MSNAIIWIHEQALSTSHPVFKAAPQEAKSIFIWDDNYFKNSCYSLKRLVFIYESLCELPIDIIFGETSTILMDLAIKELYIPSGYNPFINEIINKLPKNTKIHIVPDKDFVIINSNLQFRRFFQYWQKAKKSVFLLNGGVND